MDQSTETRSYDALKAEVIALVQEQTGAKKVKLSSRLFEDIGVAGDDGVELLEEFAERFEVDVTKCSPGRYFGGEGMNLLALFSIDFWRNTNPLLFLTV